MTDEQIIKALEEWIKALKDDYNRLRLLDAPMDCFEESHTDNIRVLSNALNLINRQKAEIEKLEEEKEQLKADNEMFNEIGKMYSELKADAIKEFADMLIQKIVNTPIKFESSYYMYRQGIAYRQEEIIDIIKEMSGDEA